MLSERLGPLKPKNPVLDRILATFRTWMVLLTLGTIVGVIFHGGSENELESYLRTPDVGVRLISRM